MAKTIVNVELSTAQEIALMERFGRKCSRETLVKRAIAEVLRMQDEDVPVFVTAGEATAKLNAEAEARREAERKKNEDIPPDVVAMLLRFNQGEQLVDSEGRAVSALVVADDLAEMPGLPLRAQFGGDNSEWFPVSVDELGPEITWRQKQGAANA